MAKVLVTGHINGIGKYIHNECIRSGHIVSGVDINDVIPWDLTKSADRQWLVEKYKDYDVFVNCAYVLDLTASVSSQNELLKLFLDAWASTNNYIVSAGSIAGLKNPQKDLNLKKYSLDKKRHTAIIDAWKKTKPNGPNVCNFNFGFYNDPTKTTDSELLGGGDISGYISTLDKANVQDFGDYMVNLINDRETIWIEEVYMDYPQQDTNQLKFFEEFGIV